MLPYLILLLLVYGVAVLFYRNQQFLDRVTFLLWRIGTPFVVGVPVLLCLAGEKPNRGMEERSSKENKDERKIIRKKCVWWCWHASYLGVFFAGV